MNDNPQIISASQARALTQGFGGFTAEDRSDINTLTRYIHDATKDGRRETGYAGYGISDAVANHFRSLGYTVYDGRFFGCLVAGGCRIKW